MQAKRTSQTENNLWSNPHAITAFRNLIAWANKLMILSNDARSLDWALLENALDRRCGTPTAVRRACRPRLPMRPFGKAYVVWKESEDGVCGLLSISVPMRRRGPRMRHTARRNVVQKSAMNRVTSGTLACAENAGARWG